MLDSDLDMLADALSSDVAFVFRVVFFRSCDDLEVSGISDIGINTRKKCECYANIRNKYKKYELINIISANQNEKNNVKQAFCFIFIYI